MTAVSDCGSQMREALNVCEEPDGPYMYADALKEDIRRLDAIKRIRELCTVRGGDKRVREGFPKLAAATEI